MSFELCQLQFQRIHLLNNFHKNSKSIKDWNKLFKEKYKKDRLKELNCCNKKSSNKNKASKKKSNTKASKKTKLSRKIKNTLKRIIKK